MINNQNRVEIKAVKAWAALDDDGRIDIMTLFEDRNQIHPNHKSIEVLITPIPKESSCEEVVNRSGEDALSCWFNLTHASWLTLPRVLMEAMPDEWQGKMAALLNEMDSTFPNADIGTTRVQIAEGNKMVSMPDWLKNYRHPDYDKINKCRSGGEK